MEVSDSSSGITRLPNEIIGEIFSHYPSLSPARVGLLAAVCTRWRNVAHTTPELWCKIDVEVEQRPPPLNHIEVWLQRSGSKPLSITITTGYNKVNLEQKNGYIQCVLRLVAPHVRRWQHLKLGICETDHVAAFREFPMLHNASQLTSIEIDLDDNENFIIPAIATAPQLKKLTWISLSETPIWEVVPFFPGANITYLDILWNRGWDSMSFMLMYCTSVVTLNLRALNPVEAFPLPLPIGTVSFPKLKTLFIETFSFDALQIVAKLDSPTLEVLHLKLEIDELDEDEEDRITPIFQRFFSFVDSGRHNMSIFRLESLKSLPKSFLLPFFGFCRSNNIACVAVDLPKNDGSSSGLDASIADYLDVITPWLSNRFFLPSDGDDRGLGKADDTVRMG